VTASRTPTVAAPLDLAAVGWVAIGALLYSTGPTMIRAASVSGPVFAFWRLWAGAVIFVAAALIHAASRRRVPTRAAIRLTVLTGLVFGVHQLFFMSAIKATTVTDVMLVQTLTPIVVGLMAIVVFRERVGRSFRGWSSVAISGAVMVALGASSGPSGDPLGVLFAFLNVFFFSIFFIQSKRSRGVVELVPFLAGVLLLAAATVTGYLALTGESVAGTTAGDVWLAVALAVVPGGLGHLATTWPLQRVPANLPPVIRLPSPFAAGLITWVVLGEAMTWVHGVGGAITVAGAFGALRSLGQTAVAPTPRRGRGRNDCHSRAE
jgi:drug/metabolite transporter (DMT)-like permease